MHLSERSVVSTPGCKEGLLKELKTILDLCAKEPVYWSTPIPEWGSNLLSK